MKKLQFKNISKKYPYIKEFLFEDVSFEAETGKWVGIVAEKQSGKSTLIKMLAELTMPTEGQILLDGNDFYSICPQNRGIGIIFDDFALMPRKSVLKNIAFPLKVRKIKDWHNIAIKMAKIFDIDDLSVKAKNLDADKKLRVSLARLMSRQDLQFVIFDDIFRQTDLKRGMEYADRFLCGREVGVLQTATDINHLYRCDKVYVLADEKIVYEGTFEQAKQFVETSNCFDKFGINDEIEKIIGDKQV